MKVLKPFILLFIFSTALGIEEDEVTPELSVPNPFHGEDFEYEIAEITICPETFIALRWSRIQDCKFSFQNRSPLPRFDIRGNLEMSREEDFTPVGRRLVDLEVAVPTKHFWTAVATNYYFRERIGNFSEKRSSISSFLEVGLDSDDWDFRCFGQTRSTWMENGRNNGQEASTDFSHRYRSGVSHFSLAWRKEATPDCNLALGSAKLAHTVSLSNRIVIGGGVYCGGWNRLWVYPHIRILVVPVESFLFRTEFDPEVELIGSKVYLEKEFSLAGRPAQELHTFRWSAELVYLLNELNRFTGRVIIEKTADPVIWEWHFPEDRLVPQSGKSYERRLMEVKIEGGTEGFIEWYINGRVDQCIDEEGYQIPNHPLSGCDAHIKYTSHPLILCVEAHYCGKRFAVRREKSTLEGFLTLSFSLGVEWERSYLLLGVENLTDNKYELLPLVSHKGKKYLVELGLTMSH